MSSEVIEQGRRRRRRRTKKLRLSSDTRRRLKIGAWLLVAVCLAYVAIVLTWIARDPRWVEQPEPPPAKQQSQPPG